MALEYVFISVWLDSEKPLPKTKCIYKLIRLYSVFGSMVNVFFFENLTLYLLIFMNACIYMFTSFFKNLHQRTLTITNMTCKCLIRPRCVALNIHWRLLGNIVISMTVTSRIFLSVCLVLWKNPYQFGLFINTNRLCIGHRNLHEFFYLQILFANATYLYWPCIALQ